MTDERTDLERARTWLNSGWDRKAIAALIAHLEQQSAPPEAKCILHDCRNYDPMNACCQVPGWRPQVDVIPPEAAPERATRDDWAHCNRGPCQIAGTCQWSHEECYHRHVNPSAVQGEERTAWRYGYVSVAGHFVTNNPGADSIELSPRDAVGIEYFYMRDESAAKALVAYLKSASSSPTATAQRGEQDDRLVPGCAGEPVCPFQHDPFKAPEQHAEKCPVHPLPAQTEPGLLDGEAMLLSSEEAERLHALASAPSPAPECAHEDFVGTTTPAGLTMNWCRACGAMWYRDVWTKPYAPSLPTEGEGT